MFKTTELIYSPEFIILAAVLLTLSATERFSGKFKVYAAYINAVLIAASVVAVIFMNGSAADAALLLLAVAAVRLALCFVPEKAKEKNGEEDKGNDV